MQLADDITSAVFLLLAAKANSFGRKPVVAGWLFKAALLMGANAMKVEARRKRYEKEASKMVNDTDFNSAPPSESDQWAVIAEALLKLSEIERNAVLLRYSQGMSINETATALRITPEAAKKRALRGLEKLKHLCVRGGVVLSVMSIIDLIDSQPAATAPVNFNLQALAQISTLPTSSPINLLYQGAEKSMAIGNY
jgi:RNA polymerase sigma-70 factor (ECF subfamily)